jgi:hypothetical protein
MPAPRRPSSAFGPFKYPGPLRGIQAGFEPSQYGVWQRFCPQWAIRPQTPSPPRTSDRQLRPRIPGPKSTASHPLSSVVTPTSTFPHSRSTVTAGTWRDRASVRQAWTTRPPGRAGRAAAPGATAGGLCLPLRRRGRRAGGAARSRRSAGRGPGSPHGRHEVVHGPDPDTSERFARDYGVPPEAVREAAAGHRPGPKMA